MMPLPPLLRCISCGCPDNMFWYAGRGTFNTVRYQIKSRNGKETDLNGVKAFLKMNSVKSGILTSYNGQLVIF